MSKRKLSRRQQWRIDKIQQERADRAAKRDAKADEQLLEGDLGPEQEGLVIAHYGTQVAVEPAGQTAASGDNVVRCHLRTNLGSLVTGDRVIWRAADPIGVVVAVLPRHSELSRPDPYGEMKTIAANIDRIIIVIAPYPEPHRNLVDRYLVAAESLAIQPIILLNKMDRVDDSNRATLQQMQHDYQELGYEWLNASATDGTGMEALIDYLAHFTSVFVGQSGVGKSSLINALLPHQQLKVGPLSEVTQKGTHTTTTAQLFHFPAGGHLIDSPGIREFGLWHMDEQDLLHGFVEFRPFLGHCKFRDCAHQSEPGCALRQALTEGRISQQRMASFRHILSTLENP
ncbi:MAG: small ribosomal subunit biogenesis GTPase RsgA [Gammaproteobacteria bacterium]|uniref:small ribosomal subunit biogenesis GTPase RsgA n=1 Tax=Pseudomaricurvus alcaniphilus TaxID=1166482 RepID=UPI0014089641|nr:small ribosomal subunit biogenesis GTPase RsgA [Pseudomaricurvus alcaniphilus]MBR9909817.1 small ribosomal subunit biogenesis GTPase RsgA [Gammaproteobacteria bacterium]NHN38543.1 small ribosomal subunit biogenesis GTPase RsgA [Pseudomaricurvus alcaniphilus]